MALSGSFKSTFSGNSNYSLIVRWSATQDAVNNKSTITLKTYFYSGSTWSIYASNFKLYTYINGASSTKTVNISSSGGKEILLETRTYTIGHNSDGTKSTTIQAKLDLSGVTISGKSLGKADTGSKSITLNTIPRQSKLSSGTSFICTNNLGISISKASSSFVHKAILKNGSTTLKSISFTGVNATFSFNQADNEILLGILGSSSSKTLTLQLETWTENYKSKMGTGNYNITMNAPSATVVNIEKTSYTIGDTISVSVKGYKDSYRHTIRFSFYNHNFTLADKQTDGTYSYNMSNDINVLSSQIPTSSSGKGVIAIETYYGSAKVGATKQIEITLTISGDNYPTIPENCITYRDSNSNTVSITGNNQYIIQGMSNLIVDLNNTATAKGGATIASYAIECSGKRLSSSNNQPQSFDFGVVNLTGEDYIYVTATDSRQLSTTISFPIHGLGYKKPTLEAIAEREGGYEDNTVLSASGTYSTLKVNGVIKNNISEFSFRYKAVNETVWSDFIPIVKTLVGTSVRGRTVIILDNTNAYDIEVKLVDSIGGSDTQRLNVAKGVPLLFMDTVKKSIGIGDFPAIVDGFEVNKPSAFNSDVAINGDTNFVGDVVVNSGFNVGGWIFTTKVLTDHPYRKTLCINNNPVLFEGDKTLWTGALQMNSYHSITLPVNINDCPNGFVLVWSDYDDTTGKANDFNYCVNYIHKNVFSQVPENKGWCLVVSSDTTHNEPSTSEITKYVYISKNKIEGNDANTSTDRQNDVVLRAVLVY